MIQINQYISLGRMFIQMLSYIAFLLATFCLNLPPYYLNLFFFIWMILNGFDLISRGKGNYHFELPSKQNLHLYFLMGLYFWMVVSLLWTNNFDEANKLLERRISFLLFPLFAFLGFNKFYKHKQIFIVFIAGTIVSVIIFFVLGWIQYKKFPESFINLGQFSELVMAQYKHRTYFGLCMIFSITFFSYLKEDIINKTSSLFYYISFFILFFLFFFVIYYSQGRMSLIIFLIIASLILLSFLLEKGYKKIIVLFLIIFVIGSVTLLKTHPRMQKLELSQEKLQQFDPRYDLWRNTIQCIEKSNLMLGVGVGDCEDVFEENHQKPDFQQYFFPGTNSHNEFLKTQLELGIVGVLLLLGIFISLLINVKKRKVKWFTINIILIWFLFMQIETIAITSTTTYLFAFLMILVYLVKSSQDIDEEDFSFCISDILAYFKKL